MTFERKKRKKWKGNHFVVKMFKQKIKSTENAPAPLCQDFVWSGFKEIRVESKVRTEESFENENLYKKKVIYWITFNMEFVFLKLEIYNGILKGSWDTPTF